MLPSYAELEISIKFPTCWDGVNAESATGEKCTMFKYIVYYTLLCCTAQHCTVLCCTVVMYYTVQGTT